MHCEKDVKEGVEGQGWRGVAGGACEKYVQYETSVEGRRGRGHILRGVAVRASKGGPRVTLCY